ncbi:MAG: hypothetical protein NC938_06365 [Candidatus Omnitrophica bacterium]|nr:hypothetical protein [Candidatus Omnitrophota bacterium]MCM8791302.1 hypothetical protein [Candidatus Omnitrophota bacterium]
MRKMIVLAVVLAFALCAMPVLAADSGCSKCGQTYTCGKCPTSCFQVMADTMKCWKMPPRGCGNAPKVVPVPCQDVSIFKDTACALQKMGTCNCPSCKKN